jgi:hypothetical protein
VDDITADIICVASGNNIVVSVDKTKTWGHIKHQNIEETNIPNPERWPILIKSLVSSPSPDEWAELCFRHVDIGSPVSRVPDIH